MTADGLVGQFALRDAIDGTGDLFGCPNLTLGFHDPNDIHR